VTRRKEQEREHWKQGGKWIKDGCHWQSHPIMNTLTRIFNLPIVSGGRKTRERQTILVSSYFLIIGVDWC
jgi:hypothetical protein